MAGNETPANLSLGSHLAPQGSFQVVHGMSLEELAMSSLNVSSVLTLVVRVILFLGTRYLLDHQLDL